VRIRQKEATQTFQKRSVKFDTQVTKKELAGKQGRLWSPAIEELGIDFEPGQRIDPKLLRPKMQSVMATRWDQKLEN
jgi:hypothetical protein